MQNQVEKAPSPTNTDFFQGERKVGFLGFWPDIYPFYINPSQSPINSRTVSEQIYQEDFWHTKWFLQQKSISNISAVL